MVLSIALFMFILLSMHHQVHGAQPSVPKATEQQQDELTFFQECVDQIRDVCFKTCSDSIIPAEGYWDYYSTLALGYKVMRKKQYNPCQDRCIYNAHYECTEHNWSRGGLKTFKLFGRWPMKRVWIFEEFASMVFCTLSVITHLYLLRKYSKATKPADDGSNGYGFQTAFKLYYILWSITFFCASIFHTKDTLLTERLDYYSAIVAIIYTNYATWLRVFWIKKPLWQFLLALPFVFYTTYHLYYMQFVSFDYGYNIIVVIVVGIINSLLWLGWCFYTRYTYIWNNLFTQLLMGCMSSFELFDFPPLFGYIDPHSIWHACIMVVAVLFTNFLIADAQYHLKRKGMHSTIVALFITLIQLN